MKKSNNISKFILLAFLFAANYAFAQAPEGYYSNADGKKGSALKTALGEIISSGFNTISYDGLWAAYKTTDLRPDGKIWDMYSNCTNFDPDRGHSGNYHGEGDIYNREHSFPKSWFNEGKPMYSDLVHVVPTDGYVNNRRSNYPFGEVASVNYESNGAFSKVGGCNSALGYSGTVFEPNDEYKGDFARIYFYMATRYEGQISSWSSPMLAGNKYPAYKDWALKMLLRWAKEDPVSQKEIDRNNGVYKLQHNRNPYVDYPGLEQYVWGTYKDIAFDSQNYQAPDTTTPDTPGTGGDDDDDDDPITPPGDDEDPGATYTKFVKVTDASGLVVGGKYLIVNEGNNFAMANTSTDIRTYVSVKISDNTIETATGEGLSHAFILGGQAGAYTLKDETEKSYLSYSGSNNKLYSVESAEADNQKWNITFNSGNAIIENNGVKGRFIQYNPSNPRFACYKSGQQPVQMYKGIAPTAIKNAVVNENKLTGIYTIYGQRIREITKPGIYIINGRKVLVQ
ncbi:MAG: endonuclease [Bacteroidaceae bacterium]|nr:endonuclease [Bacteroidaceae bacterium]